MRILIAPNAFKGCLTAVEAAEAMARGIFRAYPDAEIELLPISDGGDGLIEALLGSLGGRKVFATVTGPLGETRWAPFALLPGRTAVVEMAQASGLALLPPRKPDIWRATSFGTGQLIRKAVAGGARLVLVGMGGSATNDAGAGMAMALGAKLLDEHGEPIPHGAAGLSRLCTIDVRGMLPALAKTRVIAVSDVSNPLLGKTGSARVFGPQKGATSADIPVLERALAHFARVIERDLKRRVALVPGAGAAGGLGAGLLAFLDAQIVPGGPFVLERIHAAMHIREADLVMTGEGKLDEQSLFGKAPVALANAARRAGKPVAAVCGSWDPKARLALESAGITKVYALTDEVSERQAMKDATRLIGKLAERAVLEWSAGRKPAAARKRGSSS